MLFRPTLTMIALIATTMAAVAADLPAGSRIGEIFASPPKTRHAAYRESDPFVAIFPKEQNSPRVPGYYGRPGDFYYRSYYGTPPDVIHGRLPYACWWSGSC